MIGNWLTEAGHETAIDKKGHLRLTVKRRGCDGQIRIERQEGRLRLALTLGRWSKLEPSAEAAILRLAGEANTRSRLVRIAWLEKEGFHYCQAQVDLTGLPVGSELNSPLAGPRALMWKGMVQAAVDALKLALKRLGLELPALGDPKNKTLAEMVAMQLGAGPPADRKIQ